MPHSLVYYYVLLIAVGVCLIVIVWLLWTIRSFKVASDETLKHKVFLSQKILKFLGLDEPELDDGTVSLPVAHDIHAHARIRHLKNVYAQLKELLDLKLFLSETSVEDVMTKKVITLNADDPFHRIPDIMKEHTIRHIPVVGAGKKVVGLITQRDLYRTCSPRKITDGTLYYDPELLDNFILKEVMTKNVSTVRTDQPLGEAALKMVGKDYGCLPVVDAAGTLRGIITRGDILRLAAMVYLSYDMGEEGDRASS